MFSKVIINSICYVQQSVVSSVFHIKLINVTTNFPLLLVGLKIEREKYVMENIQNLGSITDNDEVTTISWGDDEEKEILIACGVKGTRRLYIMSNLSNKLRLALSSLTNLY